MTVITNIQDLKDLYHRRVPKMFYDYCESGSWTEQTFRENTSDFDQLRLRQRVAPPAAVRRRAGAVVAAVARARRAQVAEAARREREAHARGRAAGGTSSRQPISR